MDAALKQRAIAYCSTFCGADGIDIIADLIRHCEWYEADRDRLRNAVELVAEGE